MKKGSSFLLFLFVLLILSACEKNKPEVDDVIIEENTVTGKATNADGHPLAGVKVVVEHTVWANTYVSATTDANGFYKIELPAEPAGSWTAKAQIDKSAYGKDYRLDLAVDKTDEFKRGKAVTRYFIWKLSGERPGGTGFYGAHVDIYQWGTDVPLEEITLRFTPFDENTTLIDGSLTPSFDRKVEDVAGTYMVKDIPIGKYKVQALYPGRTLLLKNRHVEQVPEIEQTVVFGKNGYLGETEYNIEFWLSE